MKKIFVNIVFMAMASLTVNTTQAFPADSQIILKEGCDKFQNPDSFLDKAWIEAIKKGGLYAGVILTYCERWKMINTEYAVTSVFSNNRLGWAKCNYSYKTFCRWRNYQRLDNYELKKLLFANITAGF